MKSQHATFILQMIKHGDKLRAYQAAYPKAKGQSAIKAAERLLRQPEIATEIQTVMQDIRSKTVIETYKVMQQEQQVRILSVMKKREILNQIATCEMKVGRWVKEDDGYRMVYQDPRPHDIIHAIITDTKLEDTCNRMRDITDVKLSRYDIYIDGRPCDNPTAPINPDIPLGLIMLPKKSKELPLSGGPSEWPFRAEVGVGLRTQENPTAPSPWERAGGEAQLAQGNNNSMSPAGAVSASGVSGVRQASDGGGPLANDSFPLSGGVGVGSNSPDLISNDNSGNKRTSELVAANKNHQSGNKKKQNASALDQNTTRPVSPPEAGGKGDQLAQENSFPVLREGGASATSDGRVDEAYSGEDQISNDNSGNKQTSELVATNKSQ